MTTETELLSLPIAADIASSPHDQQQQHHHHLHLYHNQFHLQQQQQQQQHLQQQQTQMQTQTQTQTHSQQYPYQYLSQPGVASWVCDEWDTSLAPGLRQGNGCMPNTGMDIPQDDVNDGMSDSTSNVEESCKRALDHFPCPTVAFPMPALEFDFRIAVALNPEPSKIQNRVQKEITTVKGGMWSGSFGNGRVVAGGYDLGQARGFRPIRIVEGAFVLQTTDQPPAMLEMRTRGSLSGPCNVLDTLLNTRESKENIDPRQYGFRTFATVKTADKRYAEFVNCGLWVASGVWRGDELIIDAYRLT